jgi:hypothetical protein
MYRFYENQIFFYHYLFVFYCRPAAFILNPLSLSLWGWSVALGWSVWVSIVMFCVQCFAMVQIFNPTMAFLVDAVPGRGASVTAAANLIRMVWSCILSLIGKKRKYYRVFGTDMMMAFK